MSLPPDMLAVINAAICRARRWQKPPQWSVAEWCDELRAEANLAMLTATESYEPAFGVPLEAFVYERVLHALLRLHRREWRYALRVRSGEGLLEAQRSDQPYSSETESLHTAIQSLPDRERMVIQEIFWMNKTEREVAEAFGITAPQVHRLKTRALRRLYEIFTGGGRASKMPERCILFYEKQVRVSITQTWCDSEACVELVLFWKKERYKCRYDCGDGYWVYAGCGPAAKVQCVCGHGGAVPDCQDHGEKRCVTSPCGT